MNAEKASEKHPIPHLSNVHMDAHMDGMAQCTATSDASIWSLGIGKTEVFGFVGVGAVSEPFMH